MNNNYKTHIQFNSNSHRHHKYTNNLFIKKLKKFNVKNINF